MVLRGVSWHWDHAAPPRNGLPSFNRADSMNGSAFLSRRECCSLCLARARFFVGVDLSPTAVLVFHSCVCGAPVLLLLWVLVDVIERGVFFGSSLAPPHGGRERNKVRVLR